jgi:hypothetical protein
MYVYYWWDKGWINYYVYYWWYKGWINYYGVLIVQWSLYKQNLLGPNFVFGIDRCSVFTGLSNKDYFLHWDFIYTGLRFIQGSY